MILTRLSLRNFRSFAHASLDFGPQQNYIFGRNWQGKSSVVDALGFAMFGTAIFPTKVAGVRVRKEHLIKDDEDTASVELDFQLDGDRYRLVRRLPGSRVTLSCAGHPIASGARTVAEKLTELAEIEPHLFRNVFYSDQDELRRCLNFRPEERRQFLEKLLGVEEWRERTKFLRNTRKNLSQLLDDLRSGKLGALLDEMDDVQQSMQDSEEELDAIEEELQAFLAAEDQQEKARRKGDDLLSRMAKVQDAQVEQQAQLRVEQAVVGGLARGKCPTCLQSLSPSLQRSRIAVIQRRIERIKKKLTKLDAQFGELNQRCESVGEAIDEDWKESIGECKGRKQELIKRLEAEKIRFKRLERQSTSFGKKKQQITEVESEVTLLKELEEVVGLHRRNLRKQLIDRLQVGMNDFLVRFHDGDNDFRATMNPDGDIQVTFHGNEVPIFNLSGAMKDILALAMRYGLLRAAARGVDFIVLDEPTRHMDADNCARLQSIFDDLLDRQLIVVTINEELSDARGKHFEVKKDDALASRVYAL